MMRVRALPSFVAILFAAIAARAQDREITLDRGDATGLQSPELQALAVRLSGFFVGSFNYNTRIQMVPEFAGSAPVSSEPTRTDFRFDQFSIGAFKTFSTWLSAGASIEVERMGHRHVHGFDPDLDRKSTRLNSSHLGISYAVFCL